MPKSLREIGKQAFSSCWGLKQIALNEGLEVIGTECFQYSGIEELVIPSSVRRIGRYAFYVCKCLSSLVFAPDSALERVEKYAFGGTKLERD